MSAALGGMQNAQNTLERTAERVAGASPRSSDSVELSTEMVALPAARNQYQTNARVFEAGDKMLKKMLDILA